MFEEFSSSVVVEMELEEVCDSEGDEEWEDDDEEWEDDDGGEFMFGTNSNMYCLWL